MYDKKYFNWQVTPGEFGGHADLFKFRKYVKKEYKIIDFGCGGGFLLDNIDCSEKIGIEINEVARKVALKKGIKAYDDISFIEDGSVDLVISNHALEHVCEPFKVVCNIKEKLRKGGKFVCVVPHETDAKFSYNDINKHLYTWSPQNLVNLFLEVGFTVENAGRIYHVWPRYYRTIQKIGGWKIFHAISHIKSFVLRKGFQTIVVGVKE